MLCVQEAVFSQTPFNFPVVCSTYHDRFAPPENKTAVWDEATWILCVQGNALVTEWRYSTDTNTEQTTRRQVPAQQGGYTGQIVRGLRASVFSASATRHKFCTSTSGASNVAVWLVYSLVTFVATALISDADMDFTRIMRDIFGR